MTSSGGVTWPGLATSLERRPNQFVKVLLSDSSHLTAAYQQILRHNNQYWAWYHMICQFNSIFNSFSAPRSLLSLSAVVPGQAKLVGSPLRWLVLKFWYCNCLDCFVSGPKIVSWWMSVSLLLQVSSQPSPRDNWFDWKCSAWQPRQPVKRTTSKAGADRGRKVNYFIQWETLLTASDRSLELTERTNHFCKVWALAWWLVAGAEEDEIML